MAHCLGDDEAAIRREEQAAALARRLGLPVEEGGALLDHGGVLEDRGEYDAAEALFARALALFGQAGSDLGAVVATYHLGVVAYGRGDAAGAGRRWEEALAGARGRGDAVVAAWCLQYLALAAAERGDLPRAAVALGEYLALSQTASLRHHRGMLLATLAVLGGACSKDEAAARLLGAAERAERAEGGQLYEPPEGDAYARAAARLRQTLGEAAYERAFAAGHDQGDEEVAADARAVLEASASATTRPEAAVATTWEPAPKRAGDIAAAPGLTPRELDVLRLMARGRSNREIADQLFISVLTVKRHVYQILAKLDQPSRTAAVLYAIGHGLV
jgi:ATP/maltotriose-dependent transcriptional regulator MalT